MIEFIKYLMSEHGQWLCHTAHRAMNQIVRERKMEALLIHGTHTAQNENKVSKLRNKRRRMQIVNKSGKVSMYINRSVCRCYVIYTTYFCCITAFNVNDCILWNWQPLPSHCCLLLNYRYCPKLVSIPLFIAIKYFINWIKEKKKKRSDIINVALFFCFACIYLRMGN